MKRTIWTAFITALAIAVCAAGCSDSCCSGNPWDLSYAALRHGDKIGTPEHKYTLEGTVTRLDTAAPVSGAELTLTVSDAAGEETFSAATDERGYYSFSLLRQGNYELSCVKPGGALSQERCSPVIPDQSTADIQLKVSLCDFTYGGSLEERGYSIIETADGCLAIAGETASEDGDMTKPDYSRDSRDLWILKINPWEKDRRKSIVYSQAFGGSGYDFGSGIVETPEGYLAVTGGTESSDGDLQTIGNKGQSDTWILIVDPAQTDKKESVVFSRTYGGSGDESGYRILSLGGERLAVAGSTTSHDGDLEGIARAFQLGEDVFYRYQGDVWIFVIDPNRTARGNKFVFNATYGGPGTEIVGGFTATSGGFLAVAGSTEEPWP